MAGKGRSEDPPGARRGSARFAVTMALAVIVAGWAVLLRPTFLGGPVTYVIVTGTSMEPTVHPGDVLVMRRHRGYRVGDLVAYRVPVEGPFRDARVVHRIVGGSPEAGFVVRGDNRPTADLWRPRPRDVVGRAWLRLPGVGRFLLRLRSPLVVAGLAGSLAFVCVLTWPPRRPTDPVAASTGSAGA